MVRSLRANGMMKDLCLCKVMVVCVCDAAERSLCRTYQLRLTPRHGNVVDDQIG
jgi:hypothetical protein